MTPSRGLRGSSFRLLAASRAARSFAMSTLSVLVPLLVAQRTVGATAAGVIFSAASVGAAALLVAAGFLGDRIGRRTVLVAMAVLAGIATVGFALSQNYALLLAFAFIGALARGGGAGSGGATGPFAPVEQPLVAEVVSHSEQQVALGRLSFVGSLAGAAGSLAADTPYVLQHFGVVFQEGMIAAMLLAAVAQLAAGAFVLPVPETRYDAPRPAGRLGLSSRAGSAVWRLTLTNSLNGFGTGFLGPFLAYWMVARFHASAADLATLFTVANLTTALPYLAASGLARRLGSLRAIVWTRLIAAVFTALLAVAPTFAAVGVLYVIRMAFQKISDPTRQSFVLDLVDPSEQGRVSAAGTLPSQVTSSLSPTVGGYVMQAFQLIDLPIELAAAAQAANALLFNGLFRREGRALGGGKPLPVASIEKVLERASLPQNGKVRE